MGQHAVARRAASQQRAKLLQSDLRLSREFQRLRHTGTGPAVLIGRPGDSAVTLFLPYGTWQSAADGVAWLGRMAALAGTGTAVQLVLALRPTQQVVGTLQVIRHEPLHGAPSLAAGFDARGSAWLVWPGGGVSGLRQLAAEVHPANSASQALLMRLGFQLDGRLRQRWVGLDGLA